MNTNYIVVARLLERFGVKPTASGKYRVFDVDKAFSDAGMRTEARMRAKGELVLCGGPKIWPTAF
jgi:hypothetical protein